MNDSAYDMTDVRSTKHGTIWAGQGDCDWIIILHIIAERN